MTVEGVCSHISKNLWKPGTDLPSVPGFLFLRMFFREATGRPAGYTPQEKKEQAPFLPGGLQPVTILLPFDKIRAIPFPRQPSCVIVKEIQKKGIRSYEKIYAGV